LNVSAVTAGLAAGHKLPPISFIVVSRQPVDHAADIGHPVLQI
jgi:hypothetical protein